MKQVMINVYTAKELKEQFPEAFKRAHNTYLERECSYYGWTDEVTETMVKFLNLFDCNFRSWNAFGYSNPRFNYTYGEIEIEDESGEMEVYDLEDIKGNILTRYFKQHFSTHNLNLFHDYGNCPLTGVCFDHEPLRIIHEYLIGNRPEASLMDLIDEGLDLLMEEVESDIEYHESEEGFLQQAYENDYYFTEAGALFV